MMSITFKRYLIEAQTIFRYVYHIAPTAALPQIKQHGLTPSVRSPGKHWKHLKYNRPSIFVVTRKSKSVTNEILTMLSNKDHTPDDHESWTKEDWDKFQKSYMLLTIDLAKCPSVEVVPDANAEAYHHSKVLYGHVPPEAIIEVSPVAFDWD